MNCPDMEARIAEFLAGELEDRSGVEAHLLVCADCRATFSVARSGWEAANEWKVEGPSGDAIAATLEKLGSPAPHRGFVRVLQAGTLAASIVIAFVIGSSNRVPPVVEPAPAPQAAAPAARPSTGLASVRPSVGLLYVQDENGRPAGELAIRRLEVRVDIRDGVAKTEIEEIFENRSGSRLEGTFQFPLPPDASISRLAMEIDGKLMEGEVVEREKARRTYEGIVRSMKDPALLEWMPGGIFQCRIFPIEPRSEKRIVIAYTQALSLFDNRGRYVYPLAGESARELGIGRFEFEATIRSGSKLLSSASTSHDAATVRIDERTMRTTFGCPDFRPRADFVLAFESQSAGELQVTAHRTGSDPGYFAAYITPRIDAEEALRQNRRLFFLLDTSGSVTRAELEAARMVVRRMIRALGPSDRFRIGAHNLIVGAMPETVAPDEEGKRAAERYLADLACAGASDIAAALESAVSLVPDNGELVYIGEGTPTWGEKDPAKIVAKLRDAAGNRRISIRTVAVGSDAERNLLETISREFNGGSHAVSPSDDVTLRADEIARTLGRSALADLEVRFEGAVTEVAPATLGTLHMGERLLVTGRYGSGPAKLHLGGRVQDREIRREFTLTLPESEPGNLHVKRLWAQRKLADLVAQGEAKKAEVVKLSVECQVMTPYTSFLVLENEKAYEQHRIERTRKDADQSRDPKLAEARKLFEGALADYRARKLEDVIKKCDQILAIDPNHALAAEVKARAQKDRHRETFKEPPFEKWAKGQSEWPAPVDGEALANDIKAAVGANQWNEAEGKALIFQNGLLIVRNTPEVHRKVRELLAARHQEAGVPLRTDPQPEPGPGGGVTLSMYNVQDLTYSVQDFPGVNIVLKEDALAQRETAGKRVVEQTANGGIALTVGEGVPAQKPAQPRVPLLRNLPQLESLFGDSSDLRLDGFYVEGDSAPGFDVGPGFVTREGAGMAAASFSLEEPEQQVPLLGDIPQIDFLFRKQKRAAPNPDPIFFPAAGEWKEAGTRIAGVLTLDDIGVDYLNRPPVAGYDIGGVGFTDEDDVPPNLGRTNMDFSTIRMADGKYHKGTAPQGEETLRQIQLGLLKQNAELSAMQERLVEADRRSEDTSALESQYQELARERQRFQEIIGNLNAKGVSTAGVAPRKPLSAQVTAVASEQGLVVISIGRDAGVNEGDEFTIYRGNAFVGKMAVDRVDRAWSSGRILLKGREEPRIGDQASNNVLGTVGLPETLRVESVDATLVVLSGMEAAPNTIVVLTRNGKYVATVQIRELKGKKSTATVLPRLRAEPIQAGDIGCRLNPHDDLWSLLPISIRKDLCSESDLRAARIKLFVLRKGGAR